MIDLPAKAQLQKNIKSGDYYFPSDALPAIEENGLANLQPLVDSKAKFRKTMERKFDRQRVSSSSPTNFRCDIDSRNDSEPRILTSQQCMRFMEPQTLPTPLKTTHVKIFKAKDFRLTFFYQMKPMTNNLCAATALGLTFSHCFPFRILLDGGNAIIIPGCTGSRSENRLTDATMANGTFEFTP